MFALIILTSAIQKTDKISEMELFGGNYLSKLYIALFAVLVVPYILSKIIIAWRNTEKNNQSSDLSTLVRHETRRLGGTAHKQSSVERAKRQEFFSDNHQGDNHKVIQIYQIKIQALNQTGQNHSRLKDLEKSVHLFTAAINNKSSHFKSISNTINNTTKSHIPLREIINITRLCLTERTFILSEEQGEVMDYHEIQNLISARTIFQAFIQDTLMESSTICKVIERAKNKSPAQVYLAIRLLVLLKSGATQKGLYQMAIRQPKAIRLKFKNLSKYQLNSAVLFLLRVGARKYISANQINQLIYRQIYEFEKFKQEFLKKQSREQEKKRKKSDTNQFSTSYSEQLQEYYKILGCLQSDSTAIIKRCYHKLALKNHPDRVSASASQSEAQKAHDGFVKIQQAYNEIIKTRKKAS